MLSEEVTQRLERMNREMRSTMCRALVKECRRQRIMETLEDDGYPWPVVLSCGDGVGDRGLHIIVEAFAPNEDVDAGYERLKGILERLNFTGPWFTPMCGTYEDQESRRDRDGFMCEYVPKAVKA